MIQEYHYDDYGTPYLCEVGSIQCTSITGLDDTYGNDRFYTGREYDRGTGLYYYRARYYSPYLGRFISRDPIGTADNINLYSYVGSNPLNYTDPTGNVAGNAIAWGINIGIWYVISLMLDGYDYDWRVDWAIDFSAWFAWYGLVKNVTKLRLLSKTWRVATVLGWDIVLGVWSDLSKQYLHNPWEKFSFWESTFDNIVWVGVSSVWTYGVGRLFKGVFGGNLHGNSDNSTKPQHGYGIFDRKTGALYKKWISWGSLNKNLTSRRANSQVNKLNKKSWEDRFYAKVITKDVKWREKIKQWEQEQVNKYFEENQRMPPWMKLPKPSKPKK